MHTKAQFSQEYFNFIKRLTQTHAQEALRRHSSNAPDVVRLRPDLSDSRLISFTCLTLNYF